MGVTPTQFWSLPTEDKATIIAFYRAKSTIESYEHHLAEKKAKSARKRKN